MSKKWKALSYSSSQISIITGLSMLTNDGGARTVFTVISFKQPPTFIWMANILWSGMFISVVNWSVLYSPLPPMIMFALCIGWLLMAGVRILSSHSGNSVDVTVLVDQHSTFSIWLEHSIFCCRAQVTRMLWRFGKKISPLPCWRSTRSQFWFTRVTWSGCLTMKTDATLTCLQALLQSALDIVTRKQNVSLIYIHRHSVVLSVTCKQIIWYLPSPVTRNVLIIVTSEQNVIFTVCIYNHQQAKCGTYWCLKGKCGTYCHL